MLKNTEPIIGTTSSSSMENQRCKNALEILQIVQKLQEIASLYINVLV